MHLVLSHDGLRTDRDYLKAVQQPFTFSPIEVCSSKAERDAKKTLFSSVSVLRSVPQIAAQCGVAMVMGTWGVLRLQGSFLPIRTTEVLGAQCARAIIDWHNLGHSHRPVTLLTSCCVAGTEQWIIWSQAPTSCISILASSDEHNERDRLQTASVPHGSEWG